MRYQGKVKQKEARWSGLLGAQSPGLYCLRTVRTAYSLLTGTGYKLYCLLMTGKQMLKLLEEHGFTLARVSGSHHMMKRDGLVISVPVHGNKDLPKGTENAILKQAGLK